MKKPVAGVAVLLALTGCAALPPGTCGSGEQPVVSQTLYFGTEHPGGVVTQAQWDGFLRSEVTPRFPQGLTAWPAAGQWRMADGTIVREGSHVLSLVHPDEARHDTAVSEIVAAYKAQFRQEAVLRVKSRGCASF